MQSFHGGTSNVLEKNVVLCLVAFNSAHLTFNAVVPALGAVRVALRAVTFLSNAKHVR